MGNKTSKRVYYITMGLMYGVLAFMIGFQTHLMFGDIMPKWVMAVPFVIMLIGAIIDITLNGGNKVRNER